MQGWSDGKRRAAAGGGRCSGGGNFEAPAPGAQPRSSAETATQLQDLAGAPHLSVINRV